MSLIEIFVLALVQGITEFLPISSSAHLILVGRFLGIAEQSLFSDVAMHFGTVLAVLVFYSKPLLQMGKNLIGKVKVKSDFSQPKLILFLIIALIPTAIGGFLIQDFVSANPRSFLWIGINSIVFGALLLWVDHAKGEKNLSEMTWKQALGIGAVQILALFPGVSRSGITLTALRFFGFSREASIYFSVILSVPTILGASLLTVIDMPMISLSELFLSIFFSCIFTFLCLFYFVKWIKKMHSFDVFVYYRIVLGVLLLLLTL
ncbi:MAG: undecaprenyl-diphosphate phosphatase [Alphaproteobacteria bacterium]|nr:undecaprenyl-diphosphate phosphatase [Alphaproteobacteria bacterium]